jgi:hypothetical protein
VDESTYATIVGPEILDKLPESLRLTITHGSSGSDFLNWMMKDIFKALLDEIELCEAHKHVKTRTKEIAVSRWIGGCSCESYHHGREAKMRILFTRTFITRL